MITGRPDVTLAIGSQLERRGVAQDYPRHRLDMAHAHAALRQYPEAMRVLQELRGAAPEWLACQRYAADILRTVIQRRRTLTPDMRELADFMRLAL